MNNLNIKQKTLESNIYNEVNTNEAVKDLNEDLISNNIIIGDNVENKQSKETKIDFDMEISDLNINDVNNEKDFINDNHVVNRDKKLLIVYILLSITIISIIIVFIVSLVNMSLVLKLQQQLSDKTKFEVIRSNNYESKSIFFKLHLSTSFS